MKIRKKKIPEPRQKAQNPIDIIIAIVSEVTGIDPKIFLQKKRTKDVNWARQLAMYFSFSYKKLGSSQKIGDYFGGRNHGTILYTKSVVEDVLRNHQLYPELYRLYADCKKRIDEHPLFAPPPPPPALPARVHQLKLSFA